MATPPEIRDNLTFGDQQTPEEAAVQRVRDTAHVFSHGQPSVILAVHADGQQTEYLIPHQPLRTHLDNNALANTPDKQARNLHSITTGSTQNARSSQMLHDDEKPSAKITIHKLLTNTSSAQMRQALELIAKDLSANQSADNVVKVLMHLRVPHHDFSPFVDKLGATFPKAAFFSRQPDGELALINRLQHEIQLHQDPTAPRQRTKPTHLTANVPSNVPRSLL